MVLFSSMQMQSQLAKGWELQAIAVAVIGGVSITGGRGTVLGVVLGAVLLRLVNLALVRWEIRGEQVDVFIGGLILTAVLLDLFWKRRRT
jgi:ribose/xylose/arabinose/galactoside ABC-type transport system permease subunit